MLFMDREKKVVCVGNLFFCLFVWCDDLVMIGFIFFSLFILGLGCMYILFYIGEIIKFLF